MKKKIVITDSFFKLTQIDPQSIKEHINQQTLTMFLQKSDIIGEPVAITFHILIILRKQNFDHEIVIFYAYMRPNYLFMVTRNPLTGMHEKLKNRLKYVVFLITIMKFEFKVLYKLFKLYIIRQVKTFIYFLQNI